MGGPARALYRQALRECGRLPRQLRRKLRHNVRELFELDRDESDPGAPARGPADRTAAKRRALLEAGRDDLETLRLLAGRTRELEYIIGPAPPGG